MKKFIKKLLPSLPMYILLWVEMSVVKHVDEEYMDDQSLDNNENFIKVAIIEEEGKAYWVVNNILYEADFIDGAIDKEDAKPVDAFNMNYKEVNKLLQILDNIQDWKN